MKITTWNVNGVRARGKQVEQLVAEHAPEVLCLQEIKAAPEQIEEDTCYLPDYHNLWHGAKGGYSGVSVHVKKRLGAASFEVPSFDRETRVAVASVGALDIASVYAPNGGKDYPAKLEFYADFVAWAAERAAQGRQLVIMGDLNIAHTDLDLHPSQRKENVIGQRPEERELFARLLAEGQLKDSFRVLQPEADRVFTWWPYWKAARQNNLGWRIDYALVSAALQPRIVAADVLASFGTSDHAPFYVELADV